MKCWNCGKESATATYENICYYGKHYEMTETAQMREMLKDAEIASRFETYPHARHFCQECYTKRNKELEKMRDEYVLLKKRLMLERAVRTLERQSVDIYEYKDVIDDMAEYITEHPDKFDSSHEMIAAIVLVDNAVSAKMQYKIGSYRADFYIPEYKIVLEIDGDMHKNNLYRDNQRDIKVREILGSDWETVRISTKYLEQNAKALVDAMLAVKAEKQKIRRQHNGFLPDWYSARNKAQRKRASKVGDDNMFDI